MNCISGFLVKKAYFDSQRNIYQTSEPEFTEYSEKSNSNMKSYIVLRNLGIGYSGTVDLIYHILLEKIFALKMANYGQIELIERERQNYLKIQYPFIVHYYGYIEVDGYKCILLEYVEGHNLSIYNVSKLTISKKYYIILELMLTIQYIHYKGYIYRDLRLSNIIITPNNDVILIDFDRLVEPNKQETFDFNGDFFPPEINSHQLTTKSDIYILGYIMYYILFDRYPKKYQDLSQMKVTEFDLSSIIDNYDEHDLLEMCLSIDPANRHEINELIYLWCNFILDKKAQIGNEKFLIELLEKNVLMINDKNGLHFLFIAYDAGYFVPKNIEKANFFFDLYEKAKTPEDYKREKENFQNFLSATEKIFNTQEFIKEIQILNINRLINNGTNDPDELFQIACLYFNGKYISQNINKAIYYMSLSANLNHKEAQFNLGMIYYKGLYLPVNIEKAISYFLFAANQNHKYAQFCLGKIYYDNEHVPMDIDKAIHYFTLSANQNVIWSQYVLGNIYESDKYDRLDINKAIYYYTLSANSEYESPYIHLFHIYYSGKHIPKDINKAIHILELSAKKKFPHVQYLLGNLYYYGESVSQDINKAIHYFVLSASQNNADAQFMIGYIYFQGIYVSQDIKKSIYYLELSAMQNNENALFYLGLIYYKGIQTNRDISKSFQYFSRAAYLNDPHSLLYLGNMYYDGEYVNKDIGKAIQCFTKAANQNIITAQCSLGLIYLSGQYVPIDIDRAIHYFKLAADQNYPMAQTILGAIYLSNNYVQNYIQKVFFNIQPNINFNNQFLKKLTWNPFQYKSQNYTKDIQKSIHYLSLAASKNDPYAQYNLGIIYTLGLFVKQNVNKGIQYLILSAKQNNSYAQMVLGILYLLGKYVSHDIEKSIYYFSLSANLNNIYAQYFLGNIYYESYGIPRNIDKAIYYLSLAANQNFADAQFSLGSIYYEGLYIDCDMEKAIHYFKEASCFKNQYAKNNLEVIFKTGKGIDIDINKSIIYFEEAIKENNDILAIFNLAHIYFYEEAGISNIEKAIELLINNLNRSVINVFIHSLLCLIVIKKYPTLCISDIRKDFELFDIKSGESLSKNIIQFIKSNRLYEPDNYTHIFNLLKDMNLVYYGNTIEKQISSNKKIVIDKRMIIDSFFYEGLGNID